MEEQDKTLIWKQYEQGKQYLNNKGYYEQLRTNNNFFMGDQWEKKKQKDLLMPMPIDNIITPICNYKIGVVSQNNMSITYNSDNVSREDLQEFAGENFKAIADSTMTLLNEQASKFWENNNLETDMWNYIEECCVSGTINMYINIKDDKEVPEMVYGNNIIFADENENDIQNQQHILITFRRPVEAIKEEARLFGTSEEDLKCIVPDKDTSDLVGNTEEVDTEEGKCLCILKLYKKEKIVKEIITDDYGNKIEQEIKKTTVHMIKSSKNVIYVPETDLELTLYPVAKMNWKQEKNNARGKGEPEDKIDNQIEINKTLARRDLAITLSAYPKLAYLENKIKNPGDLDKVGVAIGIGGNGEISDIKQAIDYLKPVQVSSDAKIFADELNQKTKDNAGAGDVALGNVDPTKASGRAIIAVKDSSVIPINIHISRYKRFVEDIARILFDIWQNTSTNGKQIITEEKSKEGKITTNIVEIPYEVLQRLKVSVKVDVSPTDPYSKYAQEQAWENLFTSGQITFEEWISGLPDNSVSNKSKLEEIIQKRKVNQQIMEDIEEDIKDTEGTIQEIEEIQQAKQGGIRNEMQEL